MRFFGNFGGSCPRRGHERVAHGQSKAKVGAATRGASLWRTMKKAEAMATRSTPPAALSGCSKVTSDCHSCCRAAPPLSEGGKGLRARHKPGFHFQTISGGNIWRKGDGRKRGAAVRGRGGGRSWKGRCRALGPRLRWLGSRGGGIRARRGGRREWFGGRDRRGCRGSVGPCSTSPSGG